VNGVHNNQQDVSQDASFEVYDVGDTMEGNENVPNKKEEKKKKRDVVADQSKLYTDIAKRSLRAEHELAEWQLKAENDLMSGS
jgi:hypothetical protein